MSADIELAYKPDAQEALNRVDAWWECAILDRAVIQVTAPRAQRPPCPIKSHASLEDRWLDAAFNVACVDASMAGTYYGGEMIPTYMPNVGPEIAAACLGAPLFFGEMTSWSEPILRDWSDLPSLRFDPANKYVAAILEATKAGLEAGRGKFLVGLTDIHAGGDLAASLRDPQQLCLDIADQPDQVHALMECIWNVFYDLYQLQDRIITGAGQTVRSTWLPLYSTGRYYVPSCDFAALISPKAFNEFFLPEIEAEIEWLDRTIFHLDGPDAVRHLDSILAIDKLDAVQYVPGAGSEPVCGWMPVYKRIQEAGKAMHISVESWEVDEFIAALRPEGVMLCTSAKSVEEADALIAKIANWT